MLIDLVINSSKLSTDDCFFFSPLSIEGFFISSLTKSSKVHLNNLVIKINLSISGYVVPDSHLETACLETPSSSANSS